MIVIFQVWLSINFRISLDTFSGKRLANGTWTGILKLMQDEVIYNCPKTSFKSILFSFIKCTKMADFIIQPFSLDEERANILDFPHVFPEKIHLSLLSESRYFYNKNSIKLLDCLTPASWLMIICMFTLMIFFNLTRAKSENHFNISFDYLKIFFHQGNIPNDRFKI